MTILVAFSNSFDEPPHIDWFTFVMILVAVGLALALAKSTKINRQINRDAEDSAIDCKPSDEADSDRKP